MSRAPTRHGPAAENTAQESRAQEIIMQPTELHRRHFLRLTGLGALGSLALPLLAGCKEKEDDMPGAKGRPKLPDTELARHVAAADARGKPTLVLVIPEDQGARWTHGTFFGVTLQTADAALLRELATVHVVCATSKEVAEIAPLPELASPGPAYLIDRGKNAWSARNVPGAIPKQPQVKRAGDKYEDILANADKEYRAWVMPFRDALILSIAGDADVVKRRAARVLSILDEEDRAKVTAAAEGRSRSAADLIALAPAVFRAADYFSTDDEDNWTTALAALARRTLIDARIPGARWATNQGCGHKVDDVPQQIQPACGMGMIPESGKRFLWLFTEQE